MGLEVANTIDDLNPLWPLGTDNVSEGDDHIRNMKSMLQNQFQKADNTPWDSAIAVDPVDVERGFCPVGMIAMWSGTVATIPANWSFCNGATVPGYGQVPDLRDRFIVGAYTDDAGEAKTSIEGSPGSSLLQTGGTGNVASITSSSTSIAHTHTFTDDGHTLDISEIPAHTHEQSGITVNVAGGATPVKVGQTSASGFNTQSTGGGGSHSHSGTTDSGDASHTHTVDYPAYYALAFIIRTS